MLFYDKKERTSLAFTTGQLYMSNVVCVSKDTQRYFISIFLPQSSQYF